MLSGRRARMLRGSHSVGLLIMALHTQARVVASLTLELCEQANSDVRLFRFVALSAHRIKDASPQLRLTLCCLLEPEDESWERKDSRAALLKD